MPWFTVKSRWTDQTQQGGGGGSGPGKDSLDGTMFAQNDMSGTDVPIEQMGVKDLGIFGEGMAGPGTIGLPALGVAGAYAGGVGGAYGGVLLEGLALQAPALAGAPGLAPLAAAGTAAGAAAGDRLVLVSRWGSQGLKAGDWVMTGGRTAVNYVLSGKWQPGLTNMYAPFSSGQSYTVPLSTLQPPREFILTDWFKNLIGQRMYRP